MAYDSVAKSTVDEIFEGLEGQDASVAEQACNRVTVDSRVGSYASHNSAGSLPQLSDEGGLEEGVEAREKIFDVTNTDFRLRRYVGIGSIHDGDRLSLQKGNFAPLERIAKYCRTEAMTKLDNDLNTSLTSTSLNLSQAAGNGTWDGASSTPYADVTAALRKANYPDTMVLGRQEMQNLAEHPDFTSKFVNFTGGVISEGELLQVLRATFPSIQNFILGATVYNSANEADTVTLAFPFDGTAWVGWKEDLVLLELPGFETETQRDIYSEKEIIRYTKRTQVVRPHQEMGCVITGVA